LKRDKNVPVHRMSLANQRLAGDVSQSEVEIDAAYLFMRGGDRAGGLVARRMQL
jgi:hypothetical protein